jgi:hypothetical protein
MSFVKIFVVILICTSIHGKLLQDDSQHKKVVNYVENVVDRTNSQDTTTRDVVLLRLGYYANSKAKIDDIYESLINALQKKKLVMTLNTNGALKGMRKTALVIIVSDVYDAVS